MLPTLLQKCSKRSIFAIENTYSKSTFTGAASEAIDEKESEDPVR